jgi:phenylpropionate dioxygenase-like ring-hydroxylating dioxygenase large terminal subunit
MATPDSIAVSPTLQAADGSVLFGFWYPALRSRELRLGKLSKAMLCGIPLVMGRDAQQRAFAMRDACPHRGIPLSYGRLVNGCNIECPYHGWQFEGVSGQCKEIPSLTTQDTLRPERIFATAYPVREVDDFAWVYMPPTGTGRLSREQIDRLAPPPSVPKHSTKFKTAHLTADLPCNVDHGIIGLMDPAHGPFVHQSWWWRTKHSIHEKEKHFEPIPMGFRMSAHSPSANSAPYKLLGVYGDPITTVIDFQLPNVRAEQIRCGKYWFSSVTTVTPTAPGHTRIDVNAAWNIFLHVPLVKQIAMFFGNMFVRQDQQTMIQQAEGLKHNPSLMLIDDADKPAKWYFALKRAYLESLRTGEFMHPMSGPVTLRWRS